MPADELIERGLTFYAEIQPLSTDFDIGCMRVGCAGLRCIEDKLDDPRYQVESTEFEPRLALAALEAKGECVERVVQRFIEWLAVVVPEGAKIEPVVDTVFWDSCFIQHLFGTAGVMSPYGHSGVDLDSMFRGYSESRSANLKGLGIVDDREVAHCGLDDAIFLAKIARELILNRLGD
jgi:hypothetical protein